MKPKREDRTLAAKREQEIKILAEKLGFIVHSSVYRENLHEGGGFRRFWSFSVNDKLVSGTRGLLDQEALDWLKQV